MIVREGPETIAAFIAEPVMGAGGVHRAAARLLSRRCRRCWQARHPVHRRRGDLRLRRAPATGWARRPSGSSPTSSPWPRRITSAYVPMRRPHVSERVYQGLVAESGKQWHVRPRLHLFAAIRSPAPWRSRRCEIYESATSSATCSASRPGSRRDCAACRPPLVGEVRGVGLIGAIELVGRPARRQPFEPKRGVGAYFVRRAQEHGLILRMLAGDIVAFSPPLVITERGDRRDARALRAGARRHPAVDAHEWR